MHAMVSAAVFKNGKGGRTVFILPNPINRKASFPKSLECAKSVSDTVLNKGRTELVVEDVAFQRSYSQIQARIATMSPTTPFRAGTRGLGWR